MTYQLSAMAANHQLHVRRKLRSYRKDRPCLPDSDEESSTTLTPASTTSAIKQGQASTTVKPRRQRRKHRAPSLATRRRGPTLSVNTDRTKSVANDEDVTEENWTDAALDELFESALSAASSPVERGVARASASSNSPNQS